MRVARVLPFLLSVLLWGFISNGGTGKGFAQRDHSTSKGVVRSAHATVWFDSGSSAARARGIATEVNRLAKGVGTDLHDTPPRLTVYVFATHAAFAARLYALRHDRPQSSTDNTSEVVANTLLLGPLNSPYLQHNVAHVYAEWIVDRLTGNLKAVLPATPWLYDGLAEYEAYRYAGLGMRCTIQSPPVLNMTLVRTAQQWLSIRAGPLGELEYCLAYAQTRALVARIGWSSIVAVLHRGWNWNAVARQLLTVRP